MSNFSLLPQRYKLYLEYATKIRKLFLTLRCNVAIRSIITENVEELLILFIIMFLG
jgi:hypothetical protein